MLHEAINGLIRGYEPDDAHDKVRMRKNNLAGPVRVKLAPVYVFVINSMCVCVCVCVLMAE